MTDLPILPSREKDAAPLLRSLGFPVKGHPCFHSEMHKGDPFHVAANKARRAGAISYEREPWPS